MNPSLRLVTPSGEALARLCAAASGDSGQARRIADFLLAWHNAPENGAWDPTDLWSLDDDLARDVLTVLRLALDSRQYPADLGFAPEIERIWKLWRGDSPPAEE